MREDRAIADTHRAIGEQFNGTPDSGFLVWRHRVPIDPVNAEVFLSRREDLHGEGVPTRCVHVVRDVELVSAVGATYGVAVGYAFAIDPNFGRVVDPGEAESVPLWSLACGQAELSAIPPSTVIRAVGGHRLV